MRRTPFIDDGGAALSQGPYFVTTEETDNDREGQLARFARLFGEIRREPRSIVPLMRNRFVGLWKTRGGGFYGLGYVLVFIFLEIKTLAADVGGSESVSGFITSQIVQYVIRVSVESFLNALLALIWPLYLISELRAWGLLLVAVGFLAFVFVIRPSLRIWFPELGEDSE